jgi:hypothetical protein
MSSNWTSVLATEHMLYLGTEPLVDPLHGDPRFQSLLKQIGIRELNKAPN